MALWVRRVGVAQAALPILPPEIGILSFWQRKELSDTIRRIATCLARPASAQ